jgi:UDP-N-acetylglucosamine 2-epimerase (non-hydrolysing)
MLKIMIVVGTRPEVIKLSRVIVEIEKNMKLVLVHTGQNYDYELNQIFFEQLEIRKPDYFLNSVGNNTAETIGNIISKSDEVFDKEKPDAILIYGDTNSCLCVISAKRRKIPIFHMEAGNRCFDQRVPEELNRKIVDHLSDINLPLTEHARKYLLDEGIKPETIIKTGSCMKEVLTYYKNKIDQSDILHKLNISEKSFFVCSIHREENVDDLENFNNLIDSLNEIAMTFNKKVIFSTHPRTMNKIQSLSDKSLNPLIEIMKPLGLFDYIKLQMNAFCVISDSGTITEESSILSFPAITLRQAHERPEGMDEGTLIMSGLHKVNVIDSIKIVTAQFNRGIIPRIISDYNVDNVSNKIVKIVQSYTGYVNRTVWKKS